VAIEFHIRPHAVFDLLYRPLRPRRISRRCSRGHQSLRPPDALFGDQPIYLACVARSSSWPSNTTSDLTLSSICSADLSVLEEFPDDVPVVIRLYDLLETLAYRNSSCRPHLVLSNDIQPHLRGVPPAYATTLPSPFYRAPFLRHLPRFLNMPPPPDTFVQAPRLGQDRAPCC
jgi:hypothetical protein